MLNNPHSTNPINAPKLHNSSMCMFCLKKCLYLHIPQFSKPHMFVSQQHLFDLLSGYYRAQIWFEKMRSSIPISYVLSSNVSFIVCLFSYLDGESLFKISQQLYFLIVIPINVWGVVSFPFRPSQASKVPFQPVGLAEWELSGTADLASLET